MKKSIFNYLKQNALLASCLVIWSLLVALLFCFIFKTVQTNKRTFVVEREKKMEEIKNEQSFDSILLKSMNFCKNEYSSEIAFAVLSASKRYNIPIPVIYAIIATESGINGYSKMNINNIMDVKVTARSGYNCIGLMQISKYALDDYNKINNTKYKIEDLYNVYLNIEIGTWYYKQFERVSDSYTEMYIIYNVGYGEYNKINNHWFYGFDDKWYSEYKNKWFYMNNMMPPKDSAHGVYGKNKLPDYGAKKRFEVCLKLCNEYFS